MRAEVVEVVADLPGDVIADHARGDADRVGDALRIGASVALHDEAVEAKENRAVVVVGVEMNLQQVECRARQSEAGLGAKRALEGAAEQVSDEAGGALRGLERDIAG